MNRPSMAVLVTASAQLPPTLIANLESLHVMVLSAGSCREARRLLETNPPVDVVVTDVSLPDGNWCDLLTYLVNSGVAASLVVNSPSGDQRLWSEVLWRGAYDMLVEPYGSEEVRRVIEGALRTAHRSQPSGDSQTAVA